MKVGLELKGFDELAQQLAKLADDKVVSQIVRHAYRAGAKVIRDAAIANVPVDTGALKKSIKIKGGKRKKGQVTVLVGETDYTGEGFYGAMVEYGHGIGAADKQLKAQQKRRKYWKGREALAAKVGANTQVNDNRRQVPARPFMRPAVDTKRADAEAIIVRDIAAGIEKAVK